MRRKDLAQLSTRPLLADLMKPSSEAGSICNRIILESFDTLAIDHVTNKGILVSFKGPRVSLGGDQFGNFYLFCNFYIYFGGFWRILRVV